MISRDAYEIIGTHERVKAEIVEDVELGRMVKEHGLRSQVVHGEQLLYFKHIVGWTQKTYDSHVFERKGKCYFNYHRHISHDINAILRLNNPCFVVLLGSIEYQL